VAEIRWSPQAISDLESIQEFIGRDSPHYARLVATRIIAAVERAGEFPDSGRVVPEVGDAALREVLWRNYRIVYRARDAHVEIVTVVHAARMFFDPPASGLSN